jgi:hypothetical protein
MLTKYWLSSQKSLVAWQHLVKKIVPVFPKNLSVENLWSAKLLELVLEEIFFSEMIKYVV